MFVCGFNLHWLYLELHSASDEVALMKSRQWSGRAWAFHISLQAYNSFTRVKPGLQGELTASPNAMLHCCAGPIFGI